MVPVDAAMPEPSDAEPTALDPAGVLTRSVDAGSGFIPVQSAPPVPSHPSRRSLLPRTRGARTGVARWWPGAAALAGGVVVVVLDAVAVSLAGSGSYVAATVVAWVAIILSAVVVVGGVLVIVISRGRIPGVVAVALGLVANPFLLTRLFEVLHG